MGCQPAQRTLSHGIQCEWKETITKSSQINMLKLQIPKTDQPLKVLFLGAHSDDIEIGCGGTILRLIREIPALQVTWVVFSALGERGGEAEKSARQFLQDVTEKQVIAHEFQDGYFP